MNSDFWCFSFNLFMVFCIWIMNSDFWCMLVSYFWAMVVSQNKSDSCLAWASTGPASVYQL